MKLQTYVVSGLSFSLTNQLFFWLMSNLFHTLPGIVVRFDDVLILESSRISHDFNMDVAHFHCEFVVGAASPAVADVEGILSSFQKLCSLLVMLPGNKCEFLVLNSICL